eukprot:TRINITY_DN9160_c0_g1_i1.p1 TRINITY_DN9160_c0_g1~~TRINITY_DN9160_c0_g1_i1.p1  ORF type:complete len:573 (-),score=72.01 TRINITY_DN9160_c0_g1_i1:183-1901(-)
MAGCRKITAFSALFCVVLLGGGSWYFDIIQSDTPEPDQESWRKLEEVDWTDPSFALVPPNETIVQLHWYKGKLMHPVGRVFGGHHSVLVATGSSGSQVRIEKFGLGSVEYCPTRANKRCNLQPGMLYKSVGGRFLNNISWSKLHEAMMTDLEHYDIVDSNCHHAVQYAWNKAVIPSVHDRSPAPDDSVVAYWHDFLHWFSGTRETADDIDSTRRLQFDAWSSNNGQIISLGALLQSNLAASQPIRGSLESAVWADLASFDGHNVRRRRRTKNGFTERCRGSSLDGENNCPHRQSCKKESSSGGEHSSKKRSEFSGSKQCRSKFWFSLEKQMHSSGSSDFSFFRSMSSGHESDFSGSMHKRYQCSRPSCQWSSYEDSSQHDILPMDRARVSSDSKDADASSVSACECGHSQAASSKGDNGNQCNTLIEGATAEKRNNFICQWTCSAVGSEVTFVTASASTFQCKDDGDATLDISLNAGDTFQNCLDNCASAGCSTDCTKKCDYLKSAAMDAGLAYCTDSFGFVTSFVTSSFKSLQKTEIAATEVVGLIFWIILCCCCQAASASLSRRGSNDDD